VNWRVSENANKKNTDRRQHTKKIKKTENTRSDRGVGI
jgi:hypothetical protein